MNIFLLLIYLTLSAQAKHIINNNDDLVMLDPVEIVDIILKERIRNNVFNKRRGSPEITTLKINDSDIVPAKSYDDEAALKTRKMWSRWSKWGVCSVTCGNGNISRRRICVAGHCAPEELEEQRRPCAKSPCANDLEDATLFDDLHDAD